MVMSGLSGSYWMVRQTHATVDLCVSVFSTDMHSSSLSARPGGFLCRHKLSSQCALHIHYNLVFGRKCGKTYSEKSILFLKLFEKIDFQIHKT